MTAPATLPGVGEFNFGETSKEALMEFWIDVVSKAKLEITTGTAGENVEIMENGFRISEDEELLCSNVLLTIGRRGTPRKLGVKGEEDSKVVYRLVDPRQYQNQKVLVVGGGDSALEAALSLAEEPGVQVCLSYRGEAFNRVKAKNRQRVSEAVSRKQLRLEMASQVDEITATKVALNTSNGPEELNNDAVIVCAGGILPTSFLRSMGVSVETRFGTIS